MELTTAELEVIFEALEAYGGELELMDAVALEIEKLELEEVDFDEERDFERELEEELRRDEALERALEKELQK